MADISKVLLWTAAIVSIAFVVLLASRRLSAPTVTVRDSDNRTYDCKRYWQAFGHVRFDCTPRSAQ